MYNKFDEQFPIIQAIIESNIQYTDEKLMNTDEKLTNIIEDFKVLTATITSIMDHTNNSKFSPAQKDISNPSDPTTMVSYNRKAPPLDGGHSTKIRDMWTLKNDISSPKLYELLIKTELKGYIALDIKNLYKHINISINAVTRLQEDLLSSYRSIKRHSDFSEYFIPDCDHPFYSWNVYIYTSLEQSLLVAMTNYTCVKSAMSPQAYKVISTHYHEISGWNILSRLLHSCAPHIGGINGGVQSDIATLEFNN